MNMEEAILATLHRMETTVFARGANDCDAIMADYVEMLTGKDPMADWRDLYDDDAGAIAFIEAAGGNCALVERGMRSIGIEPKPGAEARRGDVVVVDFRGDEVTSLFLDPFVAFKTLKGWRRTKAPIMKAWTCV